MLRPNCAHERSVDESAFPLLRADRLRLPCHGGSAQEHNKNSNRHQFSSRAHDADRALGMGDIAPKFNSFEWVAATITGHDVAAIENALRQRDANRPTVIAAETVKGLGVKLMENNPAWHYRSPSKEELEAMLQELA
jgi:transketolase